MMMIIISIQIGVISSALQQLNNRKKNLIFIYCVLNWNAREWEPVQPVGVQLCTLYKIHLVECVAFHSNWHLHFLSFNRLVYVMLLTQHSTTLLSIPKKKKNSNYHSLSIIQFFLFAYLTWPQLDFCFKRIPYLSHSCVCGKFTHAFNKMIYMQLNS